MPCAHKLRAVSSQHMPQPCAAQAHAEKKQLEAQQKELVNYFDSWDHVSAVGKNRPAPSAQLQLRERAPRGSTVVQC